MAEIQSCNGIITKKALAALKAKMERIIAAGGRQFDEYADEVQASLAKYMAILAGQR